MGSDVKPRMTLPERVDRPPSARVRGRLDSLHDSEIAHRDHEPCMSARGSGTGVPPVRTRTHGQDARGTTRLQESGRWPLERPPLTRCASSALETGRAVLPRRRAEGQPSPTRPKGGRHEVGFTRMDLLFVVVGLALVSGVLFATVHGWGTRARRLSCQRNLGRLSQAMHSYATDHHDAFPFGSVWIKETTRTWNLDLQSYLGSRAVNTNSALAVREHEQAVAKDFVCPLDTLRRASGGKPRSYSMAGHEMVSLADHWPLGPENTSGVGLNYWFHEWRKADPSVPGSKDGWVDLPTIDFGADRLTPDHLPAFHYADIPAPADTLLLTEQIQADNVFDSGWRATVRTTGEQLDNHAPTHQGRYNYAIVDGHVETLAPALTVGHAGEVGKEPWRNLGLWTIRPGD